MIEIDHIAIAVTSIDQAVRIYEALGGLAGERETIENQRVEVQAVSINGTQIELLQPHGANSPVGKFILKHGEGLHHLAWRVENIKKTLAELSKTGIKPIDAVPRKGAGGNLIVFLDPKTTGGVLIELTQRSGDNSN